VPQEASAHDSHGLADGIYISTIRLSPISRFLQSADRVYHRLCNVGVVMDNFPSSTFVTIDVRDATVTGHRLSRNCTLHMLDTQFVCRIPGDLNELIAQFNLPPFWIAERLAPMSF
jgi:hypothetical protein